MPDDRVERLIASMRSWHFKHLLSLKVHWQTCNLLQCLLLRWSRSLWDSPPPVLLLFGCARTNRRSTCFTIASRLLPRPPRRPGTPSASASKRRSPSQASNNFDKVNGDGQLRGRSRVRSVTLGDRPDPTDPKAGKGSDRRRPGVEVTTTESMAELARSSTSRLREDSRSRSAWRR